MMLLCSSAALGELIKYMFNFKGSIKFYCASFILIFVIIVSKNNLITRYGHTIHLDFKKIDIDNYKKIYIDIWETPYIRYLFEYGKLKMENGRSYPNQFHLVVTNAPFNSSGKDKITEDWKLNLPKMNDLLEYDLLITPLLNRQGNNDKWILMEHTTDFWIKRSR
jgi:hypothetical protein